MEGDKRRMNNYDLLIQFYDDGRLTTEAFVALIEVDEVFKRYAIKKAIEKRLDGVRGG